VLAEEEGARRIPIIVGGFEAQAIAIELEGLNPPRPLTHDLFKKFSDSFGIRLLEVNIHKLEEGVFFANVLFDNGDKEISLDARTSDAIALALRFKCPIYTTEEIVEKAGIVLDFDQAPGEESGASEPAADKDQDLGVRKPSQRPDLSAHTVDELKAMLDKAIANENYEKASEIRDEIRRRQKE
jgi:bifunctional DNase/RNase